MDYSALRQTLPAWLAFKRTDGKTVSLKAELGSTAVSDIISGKSAKPRYPNLTRIAAALGITIDELFIDPYGEPFAPAQPITPIDIKPGGNAEMAMRFEVGARDVPILGNAKAGLSGIFMGNGEPIAYISRPPVLAGVPGAFAVYVRGDSMEDRYYDGELIYVNPSKPVRRNSFVLIELHNKEAFVKRFIKRDDDFISVEQFNPRGKIDYVAKTVKHIYRIVGSAEEI